MPETICERLDPLKSRVLFFRILTSLLLGFFLGSLCRGARPKLTSHAVQVIGHFEAFFQDSKLDVSRLVLQLNLRPIFENVIDGTVGSIQGKNLAPMRSLDLVQPVHEVRFLVWRPWAST
jgi:hypothetical protein